MMITLYGQRGLIPFDNLCILDKCACVEQIGRQGTQIFPFFHDIEIRGFITQGLIQEWADVQNRLQLSCRCLYCILCVPVKHCLTSDPYLDYVFAFHEVLRFFLLRLNLYNMDLYLYFCAKSLVSNYHLGGMSVDATMHLHTGGFDLVYVWVFHCSLSINPQIAMAQQIFNSGMKSIRHTLDLLLNPFCCLIHQFYLKGNRQQNDANYNLSGTSYLFLQMIQLNIDPTMLIWVCLDQDLILSF